MTYAASLPSLKLNRSIASSPANNRLQEYYSTQLNLTSMHFLSGFIYVIKYLAKLLPITYDIILALFFPNVYLYLLARCLASKILFISYCNSKCHWNLFTFYSIQHMKNMCSALFYIRYYWLGIICNGVSCTLFPQ
jgi:hypothetical protein